MNARKVFPSRVEDEWIGKTFLAWMTMTRRRKHHTVRSNLTGLTLLIITTKLSVTFYGKMYGKVQYRTPVYWYLVKILVNALFSTVELYKNVLEFFSQYSLVASTSLFAWIKWKFKKVPKHWIDSKNLLCSSTWPSLPWLRLPEALLLLLIPQPHVSSRPS